jgi:hypothetical protein
MAFSAENTCRMSQYLTICEQYRCKPVCVVMIRKCHEAFQYVSEMEMASLMAFGIADLLTITWPRRKGNSQLLQVMNIREAAASPPRPIPTALHSLGSLYQVQSPTHFPQLPGEEIFFTFVCFHYLHNQHALPGYSPLSLTGKNIRLGLVIIISQFIYLHKSFVLR